MKLPIAAITLFTLSSLSFEPSLHQVSSFTLSPRQVLPWTIRHGYHRHSFQISASTAEETATDEDTEQLNGEIPMPELSRDGIYQILDKEQFEVFMAAHSDKIVILKFYAPWCKACKALAPKFIQIANDDKYEKLPLIWAEFGVLPPNKDFVKSLGVLALPSVHMYVGSKGLVENFPCGPSKVPILKRKLAQVVNENVDSETYQLKKYEAGVEDKGVEEKETEPCKEREVSTTIGDYRVTAEQMSFLRNGIPFFKDFTDDEFEILVSKARLQTFEPGSVIMKQGKPGRVFYAIESGEVEVCIKTGFEDPLATPPDYLGAAINTLTANEYFGERALITGEPRAASIRAVEKTRCFAFHVEDVPITSVLSGKKKPTNERIAELENKYGLDVPLVEMMEQEDQIRKANMASQARGSLNRPKPIAGVDTDEDVKEEEIMVQPMAIPSVNNEEVLFSLLIRFKQVRQAARCFEYILRSKPHWGDVGEMKRRLLLVSRLPISQRDEFEEVFNIIDESQDGLINLLEMKRFMESIGNKKSDEELNEIIDRSNTLIRGNSEMSLDEFMGVMAEAEFYYLFLDTFNELDKRNMGFVKAGDLDRTLCGMRDLISNDQKSIIDVEDKDMLINYEQFSKMLLGATL